MATVDTIVISVLLFLAAAFIYSKFGEPISRFGQWLKGIFSGSKERFKSNVNYTKEIVYQ